MPARNDPQFPRPAPSELGLHTFSDRFYETLERHGEQAALELVQKALAAIEPPKEGTSMPQQQTKKVITGMRVEQRPVQRSATEIREESERTITQIERDAEASTKRYNETMALIKREDERTTTTTNAADPTNTLLRLTAEREAKDGIDYGEAAARVANENPNLHEEHRTGVASGSGKGVALDTPEQVRLERPEEVVTITADGVVRVGGELVERAYQRLLFVCEE
jgi:hypothetical protein